MATWKRILEIRKLRINPFPGQRCPGGSWSHQSVPVTGQGAAVNPRVVGFSCFETHRPRRRRGVGSGSAGGGK